MQEKAFFLNRESSTGFDKTTRKFPIYGFGVETGNMIFLYDQKNKKIYRVLTSIFE